MENTWYDEEEDILNIGIAEGKSCRCVELDNGMILDISEDGKILAIEVLQASKLFSKAPKIIEYVKKHGIQLKEPTVSQSTQ